MTQVPKSCITIEIGRTLVKSTDKAVCFTVNGNKEWFPKQGIRYSLEQGKLSVPFWIAEKKGLIKAPVTLSNQLTHSAPQKPVHQAPVAPAPKPAPQPVMQKLSLLEELAKVSAEMKQINQRLIAIQRELSKENSYA